MEGEINNLMPKSNTTTSLKMPLEVKTQPEFSFIPEAILREKTTSEPTTWIRNKCALIGLVFGGLAVVSWVVIIFGIFYAVAGIILSVVGLKSNYPKYARAGLALSVVGLVASFWYAIAVHQGTVNYNYFTSDFWGTSSSTER